MSKKIPIIEFKDVVKTFDDKLVLDGMNFKVFEGETFCVVGGSGSGKSVTLKLLLGLLPIDGGEIYYKGKPITERTERELNKIRLNFGMVFQGSALFDSMTVYDNVAYPLHEMHEDDDKIDKIVFEKLNIVGLADAADLFPADLSGGMKKRIGVARAIATDPPVILYDEPTAGLDPANVNRIDQLILHLQKTCSVTSALVTHNMASVYRVADRVALLQDKKVAFSGTLDEFKHSNNAIVQKFVRGDIGGEE